MSTNPTQVAAASSASGHFFDNRYYEREELHHAKDRFWTAFFLSLILFFTLNPLSCFPYCMGWRYRSSDVPKARKWGKLSLMMLWVSFCAVICFWVCAIIVIPLAVGLTIGLKIQGHNNQAIVITPSQPQPVLLNRPF